MERGEGEGRVVRSTMAKAVEGAAPFQAQTAAVEVGLAAKEARSEAAESPGVSGATGANLAAPEACVEEKGTAMLRMDCSEERMAVLEETAVAQEEE